MQINEKLKKEWPWRMTEWSERATKVAKLIPKNKSVLELGGGMCYLQSLLQGRLYLSMDIKKWTDLTIKADFNKNEFPDIGSFDYLVCQGILEYINDPINFLKNIRKYGDRMILTYYSGSANISIRKNYLSFDELNNFLKECGWVVIGNYKITPNEQIFEAIKL